MTTISGAGAHANVARTDRAPFSKEGTSGFHDVDAIEEYFSARAIQETVTALRAIDAAAQIADGATCVVLGTTALGDATPFWVQWSASSSATHDGVEVFRPTAGAASSGNGRWLKRTPTAGKAARVAGYAYVVATVAALQAATWASADAPSEVTLTSNFVTGDGGGRFRFDAGDTTTADDGVLTLVTSSGRRYKRIYQGAFYAGWFGIIANASDENASITRMMTFLATRGGTVLLPPGHICTSLGMLIEPNAAVDGGDYFRANIVFKGAGGWHSFRATRLEFTGASSLRIESGVQLAFEDMEIVASDTATYVVDIGANGDIPNYSSFNITFRRCRFGAVFTSTSKALVRIGNCSNILFEQCGFQSATIALMVGIPSAGLSGTFGGGLADNIELHHCQIQGDIQHCRVGTIKYQGCVFDECANLLRPARIYPTGDHTDDEYERGVEFLHCFIGYGDGAHAIAFYTQGNNGYGLNVRNCQLGGDYLKGFVLTNGYATFNPLITFEVATSGSGITTHDFTGIEIGASAQHVFMAAPPKDECTGSGTKTMVSDLRTIDHISPVRSFLPDLLQAAGFLGDGATPVRMRLLPLTIVDDGVVTVPVAANAYGAFVFGMRNNAHVVMGAFDNVGTPQIYTVADSAAGSGATTVFAGNTELTVAGGSDNTMAFSIYLNNIMIRQRLGIASSQCFIVVFDRDTTP